MRKHQAQIEFDKQNDRNNINVPNQIYSTDGSEEPVVRLLTHLT